MEDVSSFDDWMAFLPQKMIFDLVKTMKLKQGTNSSSTWTARLAMWWRLPGHGLGGGVDYGWRDFHHHEIGDYHNSTGREVDRME